MTLMTIHAAKGLEFENVFLIGLEEGVFPGRRSMDSPEEIEEERRLAYVAITRAKKRLYITTTSFRMLYGQTASNTASRFLREMDQDVIEKEEPERQSIPAAASGNTGAKKQADAFFRYAEKRSDASSDLQFAAGDRVKSFVHGEGTVLSVSPMGGDVLLEIAFDRVGTKKIMAKYARIRKVSS